MKIIHAIGQLQGGGAETQLDILLHNTQKADIENVVISFQQSKNLTVKQIQINKSDNIFKKWKTVFLILKNEKPNIFHIWIPAVFYIFLIPALFCKNCRIVLGVRSAYQLNSIKRFIHLLLYIPVKYLVANTHLEDQHGAFMWVFRKKLYKYIPNAIKYTYKPRLNLFPEKSKFQILYIGRLIKLKNINLMIKSLAELKKNYSFILDVCGIGPLENELIELTRKEQVIEHVRFNGYIEDLSPFLEKANILILPSSREGMPNVVFEAMAFNVIPVLSDLPQHKRWFDDSDSAVFFNSNDQKSLKKSLIKAFQLSPLEIKRMNEANRKIVDSLSVEKYCHNYYDYYNQLIQNETLP